MNETLQVAVSRTSADDCQWRHIDRGRRGHLEVGNRRFGNEDPVDRQDDGVVVLYMGSEMVVARLGVMVVFEVRVRDHLVAAVRPLRAVHVLHRGQRQAGQGGDEAERYGAIRQHYSGMLRDRCRAGN